MTRGLDRFGTESESPDTGDMLIEVDKPSKMLDVSMTRDDIKFSEMVSSSEKVWITPAVLSANVCDIEIVDMLRLSASIASWRSSANVDHWLLNAARVDRSTIGSSRWASSADIRSTKSASMVVSIMVGASWLNWNI